MIREVKFESQDRRIKGLPVIPSLPMIPSPTVISVSTVGFPLESKTSRAYTLRIGKYRFI